MRLTKAIAVIVALAASSSSPVAARREIPIHDSRAVISLQQTVALYPLAIDSKDFAALDRVFAQDVIANYSAPLGVLSGLATVKSVLAAVLAPVLTQHALATFSVSELKGDESATTVSYYTANHFGKGVYAGQVYYAYGQYVDEWKVIDGSWKIVQRQLNYMGPGIGNPLIFTG